MRCDKGAHSAAVLTTRSMYVLYNFLCLLAVSYAFIKPLSMRNMPYSVADSFKLGEISGFEVGLKPYSLSDLKASPVLDQPITRRRNKFEGPLYTVGLMAGLTLLTLASPAMASTLTDDIIEKANSSGFVQAFLLIFVSEIGDKTFFIAGLLAAKYSRLIAFSGSLGALAVMTVISTALGQIFHSIPSGIAQGIPFDDYVAVAAFTYFGGKTLYDAMQLDEGDSSGIEEEKEEAEKAVEEVTGEQMRRSAVAAIVQTFSLVFAAEIGDRSFLSTIALSAALNPVAVASGAIAAHGAATGIAVIGGAVMSQYLSEKTIGYIGGSLFLLFAVTTALGVF